MQTMLKVSSLGLMAVAFVIPMAIRLNNPDMAETRLFFQGDDLEYCDQCLWRLRGGM